LRRRNSARRTAQFTGLLVAESTALPRDRAIGGPSSASGGEQRFDIVLVPAGGNDVIRWAACPR